MKAKPTPEVSMTPVSDHQNCEAAIIRTERGLTIAGTRITIYDIMGHLEAGWTPKLMGNWLSITDEQLDAALSYIDNHRREVEAEYQTVLKIAQEIRDYWEEKNRERFEQIAKKPPLPGQEAVRAKLKAWKIKRQFSR
ncbi:DUF433 domain-containing protein [Moorena sp. SIO3E8]|uniref:DUF433 domain-containing protein n=2 Tax=unclassified Moorena TaxID=2683338 RepID=UPI0025FCD129|nr:DUF433 domain-containing protein [Moorena sp. SIO3E8]